MTWIRLVQMLFLFLVAHKAAYQTLSKTLRAAKKKKEERNKNKKKGKKNKHTGFEVICSASTTLSAKR